MSYNPLYGTKMLQREATCFSLRMQSISFTNEYALAFKTGSLLALSLMLLVCSAFWQQAHAAQPKTSLRIIYSANTLGQLSPLYTSEGSLGGLARRESAIAQLKSTKPAPNMHLVGSHEFAADSNQGAVPLLGTNLSTDTIRRIYNLLNIDVGYLSTEAAALFRIAQSLPINFHVLSTMPVVERLQVSGQSIGVVLFPPIIDKSGKPYTPSKARNTLAAVLKAGKKVSDASLVIGVSPWGADFEKSALPHLSGVFHMIFGGGSGGAQGAAILAQAPSVLWIRPGENGYSLNIVNVLRMPGKGRHPSWIFGKNVTAEQILLTDVIKDSPKVNALLH